MVIWYLDPWGCIPVPQKHEEFEHYQQGIWVRVVGLGFCVGSKGGIQVPVTLHPMYLPQDSHAIQCRALLGGGGAGVFKHLSAAPRARIVTSRRCELGKKAVRTTQKT